MNSLTQLFAAACLLALCAAKVGASDPTPAAGQGFSLDFPELGEDFSGNPMKMEVWIPTDWDAGKKFPLLIFLPGGKGGNSLGEAKNLGRGKFICAGLPYPDTARNPAQENMVGDFKKLWKAWEPMFERLEKVVPNIDPERSVIGGFSNGAHAIDGLLEAKDFIGRFSAYFLIDGGGALGDRYKLARGKQLYAAYGEKSPARTIVPTVVERAKKARMVVVSSVMEDSGHSFTAPEKEKVAGWIHGTVLGAK